MAEAPNKRNQPKPKPRLTKPINPPRITHLSSPSAIHNKLLGRTEDLPSQQKPHEVNVQQAKRAAISQAQAMGAIGNFKSFDSQFGNYLVPVIPTHIVDK